MPQRLNAALTGRYIRVNTTFLNDTYALSVYNRTVTDGAEGLGLVRE